MCLSAGEEHFTKAVQVVITWLERGDCNKRNANSFYSMIQSTNSHVRRLLTEKATYEDELTRAKELMKGRMQGLLIQCKYATLARSRSRTSRQQILPRWNCKRTTEFSLLVCKTKVGGRLAESSVHRALRDESLVLLHDGQCHEAALKKQVFQIWLSKGLSNALSSCLVFTHEGYLKISSLKLLERTKVTQSLFLAYI